MLDFGVQFFFVIDFVPAKNIFFNYSLKSLFKINNNIYFLNKTLKQYVSLMGTGLCLKGTKLYSLSTSKLF